jgi:hypothetical protein
VRAAAPFAILETMYKAVELITTVDQTVEIPQLVVNWSVNNIASWGDKTIGEIGTSHFTSAENQLYILGAADSDTDEYDSHVIAHEWGHFFQANLSRSDSTGGSHSSTALTDPRLAFGEGFGNAISGMVLNDPVYVDTLGSSQNNGFSIDVEDNDFGTVSIGWYSEASVQAIIYDLYDSASDGPDSVSLGFGPIYDVLVGDVPQQDSFVTIFSFIDSMKTQNPEAVTGINALLAYENISTTFVDEWDSTGAETNFSSSPAAPPAVYTELAIDGTATTLCGSSTHGSYNKLFNRRFFYFTIPTSGSYTIAAAPLNPVNDVDFIIYDSGDVVVVAAEGWSGVETTTQALVPGVYAGEVYEYGHIDSGFFVTSSACFSLTVQ